MRPVVIHWKGATEAFSRSQSQPCPTLSDVSCQSLPLWPVIFFFNKKRYFEGRHVFKTGKGNMVSEQQGYKLCPVIA